MNPTLLQMRTAVRQLTGTVNSQIVTDAELNLRIAESACALYDEVIGIYEHYFVSAFPFTITTLANTVALPANFYKDNGVDFNPGPNAITVHKLGALLDRNRRDRAAYGVVDQNLVIYPPQSAMAGNYQLYYTPQCNAYLQDFTVRLVSVGALPSVSHTGGPGPGASMTATSNGALSIDGTAVAIGDRILLTDVAFGGPSAFLGIYTVTNPGSVSTLFTLVRATDFDQANVAEMRVGANILATAGATASNSLWTLATFAGTIDVSTQSYAANALDNLQLPIALAPWYEYVQLKAALSVFAKRQMDPGDYMAQFARQEARVRKMAANRTEEPGQVPLTRGARTPFWDEDLPT